MQQKDIDQRSQAEKAYDLAATRVLVAAQRLRDRLRFEMRYNPDWSSQTAFRPASRSAPGDGPIATLG